MLEIGNKVPDFQAINQNEQNIKLSDHLGKKVVVYFYPKDNTPGCTTQSCNLRDNYEELLQKGYVVLGVSTDSAKSHQKFINKFDLPFPLLVDSDKKIHHIFGTWVEKKTFGKTYMGTLRKTFVINETGILIKIIDKVKTNNHTEQIIEK